MPSKSNFNIMSKRTVRFCLILATSAFLSLCLNGCSNSEPVRLLNANYFTYADGGYGSVARPYLCVNWQNQTGKTVDYMEITAEFFDDEGTQLAYDGKESFEIRMMEDFGVEPGQKNTTNLTEVPFKFDTEPSRASIRINRISFADGSTWINESEALSEFPVGENETSEIPVVIDEVNFYKSSPQATARFINIDWHNRSPEATTLAVEFKITGHNTSSKATESEPITYLTLSDRVSPGGENNEWKSQFSNNFSGDINEAAEYSICVHRVIDTDGNVWVNDDGAGEITATFVGKKGCAFGDYSQYPEVNKLVKSIHTSLVGSGTEESEPEVFVKPGSHCVIRYPDLDITVKLDDTCSVADDWVAFSLYYKKAEAKGGILLPRIEKAGSAILPAALTSMPSDAVIDGWVEYWNNDATAPQFPDSSFQYKEDFGGTYEDYNKGSVIGHMRVCVAKDLSGAFDHDWAKRYPY